jgi:hypothetical protein
MNAHFRSLRKSPLAGWVALATLLAPGCGESITASPVDPSTARAALKTTLDAWKADADPASLKSGSPAITAQDLDWITGAKLVEFKVEGDGNTIGSNLRVPVRLDVKTKDGKVVTKNVNYLVGTSPAVTVFRDIH